MLFRSEADEYGTPLEEPSLFVDHSCVNTIREFNNYRAPSSVGRVLRNPREDAQKYDDHALDAIRYALMHIYKLGCTRRLGEVYTPHEFEGDVVNNDFGVTDSGLFVPTGADGGYFTMADLEHL